MKIKFLPLIAVLFAATSIMTSCLDNDVEQIRIHLKPVLRDSLWGH